MTLGIRAFGTNAYTAAEPGLDVVEPHTENHERPTRSSTSSPAAGPRSRSTARRSTLPPARTFVPDPASHRHAVAVEAGTTVLSFGGPPTFEPSAWEWSFQAAATRKDDPAKARAMLEEGLEIHPESAGGVTSSPAWRQPRATWRGDHPPSRGDRPRPERRCLRSRRRGLRVAARRPAVPGADHGIDPVHLRPPSSRARRAAYTSETRRRRPPGRARWRSGRPSALSPRRSRSRSRAGSR